MSKEVKISLLVISILAITCITLALTGCGKPRTIKQSVVNYVSQYQTTVVKQAQSQIMYSSVINIISDRTNFTINLKDYTNFSTNYSTNVLTNYCWTNDSITNIVD